MPDGNYIPENRPDGQEQTPHGECDKSWQPIGELARKLAEKADFLPVSESLIDYDDTFGGSK